MNTDKSREQFEAWWRKEMNVEVMDLHRCNFPMKPADFIQPYACHETERSWWAWQESRKAIVIELPEKWGEYTEEGRAACEAIDACQQTIEASGLKVAQ